MQIKDCAPITAQSIMQIKDCAPITAQSIMQMKDWTCTNHSTTLLLGHQGKCAPCGLGGNSCSISVH
jgi:hypothetical protein